MAVAIKGIVRTSCVRKINRFFFFLFEMESWKLKAINHTLVQFGALRPVSSYASWSGMSAAFVGLMLANVCRLQKDTVVKLTTVTHFSDSSALLHLLYYYTTFKHVPLSSSCHLWPQ